MTASAGKPLRICQICTIDFTLYHFLLPLMRAQRDAGHDVEAACADGPFADKVRAEGFRVHAVPLARSHSPVRNARAAIALYRMLRAQKYDMVHTHTPAASFVGRLSARAARVPRIVYTAHGFFFHEHMPRVKRSLYVTLEWLGGRATDTLFTQAEEDAETARRLSLCRTGDIMAIGNGSDPDIFYPGADGRHQVRESLGTDGNRTVILVAGRLVAEKGYPELIAAMRDIDAELWVVGDRLDSDHAKSIDDSLREATTDPVLSQRVRFLGYRSDMPDLMRAADIFTLPSHREGMPRSIIEAMLSGLPVVATDIRGSREEVVDGETGLLVPVRDSVRLAEALSALVEDGERRSRMGSAGRLRAVKNFDEDLLVARQLFHLGLTRPAPGDRPS